MTQRQRYSALRKAEKLRSLVIALEGDQAGIAALGVEIDQQDFNQAKRAIWHAADALEAAAHNS